MAAIITVILHMGKWMLQEVKESVQGYKMNKGLSWDSNAGVPFSKFILLTSKQVFY